MNRGAAASRGEILVFCHADSQLVTGPAADGGYYLIGMRAPGAPLFEGVAWGSERVLARTRALARAQGLVVASLPERFDVDTLEGFERWQQQALSLRC
jgi:glycosyltransferase A (GT-A) superfamily protein (DUF2064 family)